MPPNQTLFECVGSVSLASLWTAKNLSCVPFSTTGNWEGSLLGNDAVIVAAELQAAGLLVNCHLLNPTDKDFEFASEAIARSRISAVDQQSGCITRSLCIEDASGVRNWIHSRVPRPKSPLIPFTGDYLYLDYYPEFVEFFNKQIWQRLCRDQVTVVNCSAINDIGALPTLSFKPCVVQASVPQSLSTNNASILAREVLNRTSAQEVFLTRGECGAILAIPENTWVLQAPRIHRGPILGAGAIFSVALLLGLGKGLDQEALLDWCINETAERISKVSRRADHRP
ncbi:MAG: hypothetical protein QOH39_1279 [Verrucomicrobiota bacterium]